MRTEVDIMRLINTFRQLARIKSPSGKEDKLAGLLTQKLRELGLTVQADAYGNLIAKLDGIGEPIILCAHMDTVAVEADEIQVIIESELIKTDGKTILGADNKDAIAAILEMLEILKDTPQKHRPIELVLTREEEAISQGARNLDFSLLTGKECWISDLAEPFGSIVYSAPHNYRYTYEIQGVRAHVREPKKGKNAIAIMSEAITLLPPGVIDDLTTHNVAWILGGLAAELEKSTRQLSWGDSPDPKLRDFLTKRNTNTVPDLAIIVGEVRGASTEVVEETLRLIHKVFELMAEKYGVGFQNDVVKLASGYLYNDENRLVKTATKIFKAQGVEPREYHSIGGSDANIFMEKGLETLVFSSASRNNHQVTEYVIIDELVKLADFFLRLVKS